MKTILAVVAVLFAGCASFDLLFFDYEQYRADLKANEAGYNAVWNECVHAGLAFLRIGASSSYNISGH